MGIVCSLKFTQVYAVVVVAAAVVVVATVVVVHVEEATFVREHGNCLPTEIHLRWSRFDGRSTRIHTLRYRFGCRAEEGRIKHNKQILKSAGQLEVESSRVIPIKKLCYHSGAGISTRSWRIGHAECSVLNSLRKKVGSFSI